MRLSLNHTRIRGRLGQDVEYNESKSGNPYARFSVAVTNSWKTKHGDYREETDWFPCVAFGKIVDDLKRHEICKGHLVEIDGRMQSSKYETEDGKPLTSWALKVDDIASVHYVKKPPPPPPEDEVTKSD